MTTGILLAYQLTRPFVADASVLGSVTATSIAGRRATVHTPEIRWTSDSRPYWAPPEVFRATGLSVRPYWEHRSGMWGSRQGLTEPTRTLKSAQVEALVFEVDPPEHLDIDVHGWGQPAGPFVDSAFRDISRWETAVTNWVEVLTGQANDPAAVNSRVRQIGEGLIFWAKEGDTWSTPVINSTIVINWAEQSPISLRDWRRAVSSANSNGAPPLEHLLIRDARVARAAGNYRMAVIDAGSAAELALTRLLDNYLAEVPKPLRKAVTDENKTLGRLAAFVQRLGVQLPAGLKEKVVDPRNVAVHGAETPDWKTATEAVRCAALLITTACPLDGPDEQSNSEGG